MGYRQLLRLGRRDPHFPDRSGGMGAAGSAAKGIYGTLLLAPGDRTLPAGHRPGDLWIHQAISSSDALSLPEQPAGELRRLLCVEDLFPDPRHLSQIRILSRLCRDPRRLFTVQQANDDLWGRIDLRLYWECGRRQWIL